MTNKICLSTIDKVLATLDAETEYIGEDGLIHCKFCHDTKMFADFEKNRAMRCPCKCLSEKNSIELAEEARHEKAERERQRVETARLGAYRDSTFESTDIVQADSSFQEVYTRLQMYCRRADTILERGLGFYLYGKTGTGKTHLMSCVANRLLASGYSVLFTNVRTIKNDIQVCYKKNRDEREVEQYYIDVDFLFIDDLGAEKLVDASKTPYAIQTNLYNIIDGRLRARKPTNYTSNLTIAGLVSVAGLEQRTIDRINLASSLVKEIKGENYRAKIVRDREEIF